MLTVILPILLLALPTIRSAARRAMLGGLMVSKLANKNLLAK